METVEILIIKKKKIKKSWILPPGSFVSLLAHLFVLSVADLRVHRNEKIWSKDAKEQFVSSFVMIAPLWPESRGNKTSTWKTNKPTKTSTQNKTTLIHRFLKIVHVRPMAASDSSHVGGRQIAQRLRRSVACDVILCGWKQTVLNPLFAFCDWPSILALNTQTCMKHPYKGIHKRRFCGR